MLSCQAVDCEIDVIGNSKHCENHAIQFKPLYLKYKRLHTYIKDKIKLPLETFNVYELLKLSSSLEELYQLRSDYRKVAFRPEYHDIGHSRILHEVLRKLDEVRSLLTQLFEKEVIELTDNNTEDDNEQVTPQGSINFVNNIRQSVVNKHKEEWDKQSLIDYHYNTQTEAKLKFIRDSSLTILQKMNIVSPKRMFEIMFIIFGLQDYIHHNKDNEQLISVVFIEDLYKYIDKHKLTFKLSSAVYKSLITKEPSCIINNLSHMPTYKPRVIATCSLNNFTIISLHKDSEEKYVCPFKITETECKLIDGIDILYVDKVYDTYRMLRSSISGLSVAQKLRKIRDIKQRVSSRKSKKSK